MNYESFLREENGRIVFVECWMDRCIDRNGEYIPSYPYWTDEYTPLSWVDEGMDNCIYEASNKMDNLMEIFNSEEVFMETIIPFNEDVKYKSDMETGWDVYSIEEFMNLNHKLCEYEGYVYYGYSKIVFGENVSKNRVLDVLQRRL